MKRKTIFLLGPLLAQAAIPAAAAAPVDVATDAQLFPLASVRLLDGPFAKAVDSNRRYLLALDPDRLLAPFLREAGLPPKARAYGNWESGGLDGHTAGHYLAALANMIAAGQDTPEGEFRKRLDHMLDELDRCQKAYGDGYIGGVPGSRELWKQIAAGNTDAVREKWVPWYNVHKTFAGLRDVHQRLGDKRALHLLVRLGDWCVNLLEKVPDDRMQRMLGNEYGGMNEVMADIHALTGERKYLDLAKRFNHKALFDPLMRREDKLTGMHANTQIPKIIGMERIATLTRDGGLDGGARFFWETVTQNRNVAFGGNSVAEHFNDPKNFRGMLEHREGPETCNTYNMLRLTEQLFASRPGAAYADYYERALYNHILASIHPTHPGYAYFTPIRPGHYRVYSEPDHCFWCCVGTGMENPGKYGEFIYAKAKDGVYVNLFIPSELRISEGIRIRQETEFPYEARTRLTLALAKPSTFTLRLRHPAWSETMDVKVNGQPAPSASKPSSYAELRREWKDGDTVELGLAMRTTVERLPDGSDWAAILHGPIVLASPAGTDQLVGLRADGARMGHVAHGPLVPLDRVPVVLASDQELPAHVKPDPAAGPLHFRLTDVVEPKTTGGLPLIPFFTLHDARYQMYWELTSAEKIGSRREQLAAAEQARAAREAATIDSIAVGEQQPEVEHDLKGDGMETGMHEGRRWRHGAWFQYTLDSRGEKNAELEITIWGGDAGRSFDILANDTVIATVELKGEAPGKFVTRRFKIPSDILAKAKSGKITVKFAAKQWLAGGIFDVRLMKPAAKQD